MLCYSNLKGSNFHIMRLAFILSFILMFTFQSTFCQIIEKPETNEAQQESYNFYMSKKKSNENVGWILLGTGAAVFTAGLLAETESDPDTIGEAVAAGLGNELKNAVMIGGGVIAASSIPFFIIASNHKNRATLALKGGSISYNNVSIPKSKYIGLSINIPIGN